MKKLLLCALIVAAAISPISARAQTVAPAITAQPTNQTVIAGQRATFSISVTDSAPMNYEWRKNGVTIIVNTSSSYTTPATTTADSGAIFSVRAYNSTGSVTSHGATLTVNGSAVAPAITTQPTNQTVIAGQTVTFSISVTGSAPMNYEWRRNGVTIIVNTSSSYTTPATTSADSGVIFSVRAYNSTGSVTSHGATLTVNGSAVAPAITTQPTNQTVIAGRTATFSVAATGTVPLSYQWRKNGTLISGATSSSYATPATASSDSGAQFTVVVSNSASSATSNVATLTVNAATVLLSSNPTSLSFGSVNVSSSKMLSATISNTGNSNITIASVSQSGPGFSASGLSSGLILAAGQTATLNVTFAPSSAGNATGSVSVSSNATNSPASIALTGTGVQPVQHTVTLSWSASKAAVAGYYAYRGTVSGGPYVKLNSSPNASLSYTDSTVQAGQTYYYVVTCVDSSGVESTDSNQVQAVVPTP